MLRGSEPRGWPDRRHDLKPRLLEAEGHAPGPGEEVDADGPPAETLRQFLLHVF